MMGPYLWMAVLYLTLAALLALTSVLQNLDLLSFFNGLKWLRVHLITLGGLTQLAFGLLPILVAARYSGGQPRMRWETWLALNLGLLILLPGIPLYNAVLIITGGSLVFAAAGLLAYDLARLWRSQSNLPARSGFAQPDVRPFYLASLAYLLVGVLAGTGLWFGWGPALGMVAPVEVHVHANLWGFTALLLAGLVTQLYPALAGTGLAWPKTVKFTFWGMFLGALGLVSGPWLAVNAITVAGLIVHSLATIVLVANWAWPLIRGRMQRTPGMLHILLAYIWFFFPVVVAPLIVFRLGEAAGEISGSGGPILIYGWILPIIYALLPYIFRRLLRPYQPAQPGGTWSSLLAVQAGSLVFWISLFVPSGQQALRAAAYGLWLLSLALVLFKLWGNLQQAACQAEDLPMPAHAAAQNIASYDGKNKPA
jgi:hypothetical protein